MGVLVSPASDASATRGVARRTPEDPGPPPSPLRIRAERCKGCELCIAACTRHALALDMSRVNGLGHHPIRLIDAAACTSCVLCARVCPDEVFIVYAPVKAARS